MSTSAVTVDAEKQHTDLSQSYSGGAFITLCECGQESTGQTPDDADAAHMEHAANR